MTEFIILPNQFLSRQIRAFYHQDYIGFRAKGNPDVINNLKNQFGDADVTLLSSAANELRQILSVDLHQIKVLYSNVNLTICVIPRAKAEKYYLPSQKLFRQVISDIADELDGYSNGATYIIRYTNTKTTHMTKSGYGGTGELPYVGITKATCIISADVKGKDILLIDDLYTSTINVDEDAIQALLDTGANSVIFYSVGKTAPKY